MIQTPANIEKAKALLEEDAAQNAYALLRIRQNGISECRIIGRSVRLLDSLHVKYMYAVSSMEEFIALFEEVKHRNGPLVSLISNTTFLHDISNYDKSLSVEEFYQLQTTRNIPKIKDIPGISFRKVLPGDAKWILSVYEHPELSEEFIAKRAQSAPSVLAETEDGAIGFFLTHSDAEIGPAFVVPEYRASGLSEQLYARIMAPYALISEYPMVFIRLSNQRSFRWLTRMGCGHTDNILWFWRDQPY